MSSKAGHKILWTLMVGFMLVLVSCSNDTDGKAKNENTDKVDDNDNVEVAFTNPQADENGAYDIEDFPTAVSNTKEPIDGGELTYGIVSDSAFAGTLNYNLYSSGVDSMILEWIGESLLWEDEDFLYSDDGIASFEYDEDEKTMTFTLEDGVKWSDGEPLTADDYKFAYEVIGHPGYDGPWYDSSFTNVKGMEEYHDGVKENENGGYQSIDEYREENGETISGIEVLNDQTIKITFKEFTPSLLAGGVWYYAMPVHIFGDMPVAEMSASDEVRKHPVGLGPYKVDEIVEGESVTLSPNEYYWRGEPQLDKVTLKVVDSSNIVQELKKGTVDIASFPTDKYPDNDDLTNVQFLAITDTDYSYIGFKLGTWDKENHVVDPDPDMKMADRDLRKAMWHAVDTDALGDEFYHGLRWRADTLIPPSHANYQAKDVDAPTFDPDKANEILDEAGYEWKDGEDYRTDKDGNELVITFASMVGGDAAEPIAKYYIQSWADIGLNVELLDGRLQEYETFYDRVGDGGNDDPDIDIFQGGWSLGADVDPSRLYGPEAMYNFPRYQSDEQDELIREGLSKESLDIDHRIEVYKEWQKLMIEDIPVFPTLYQAALVAVNSRVTNYDIDYGADTYLYELGVTEENAEVAE